MKAITLWQPWATLVALGVKTIETRSWTTAYRGPLAIHAAARRPKFTDMKHLVGDQPAAWNAWYDSGMVAADGETDYMPLGAVVAICTLVDVVPMVGPGNVVGPSVYVADPSSADFPSPDGPWGWQVNPLGREVPYHGWIDFRDQAPYGDFTPGRFGWLLDNIIRLPEPPAARGGQRIWNWRE